MTKYKIFVSANQKELRNERFAVKEIVNNNVILRDYFNVFLFEDLPAKGKSPFSEYLKHVESSDIYICIIGNEYGIKGQDKISATEREFSRFTKANPRGEVLAFIKGDSKADKDRDKDMQRFIKIIKDSFIYKRFNDVSDFKIQIINSLDSFLDDKGILNKEPFDKQLCKQANYTDIDETEVRAYLEERAVKLKVNMPKITIKDLLNKTLGIIKNADNKIIPTNTALLFFGKYPSEFIPQNEIRIARFKGTTRLSFIDSQEIKGPIYRILEQVELFFKRNTRLANKIVEFKRVDIPEYPYEAVREAVINAIAHRDYTRLGAPIMISIFDDRVEISSPGGLLPHLNIKKLEGHHETRNKKICEIFHETKDMEKFGTGIVKMKRLMKEHGLSVPELLEESGCFVVKFYGPGDEILDLIPDVPKERQTDLRKIGLNNRQIESLRIMVNEKKIFTVREYMQNFKVTDKTARTDLKELVTKNFIEKVGGTKGAYFRAKTYLPK